ncbi:Cyanovirin-N [Xylariaceae sp. FL1272]|nr:Cyanovirin-N [Xylariaceae sp. FL1272]
MRLQEITIFGVLATPGLAQYVPKLTSTCVDIHLTPTGDSGHDALQALCAATNGTSICTILDLNNCFGFKDGNMQDQDKGNFQDGPDKCQNCKLQQSMEMDCDCPDEQGGSKTKAILLDATIHNDDGVLRCFANFGSTTTGCVPPLHSTSTSTSTSTQTSTVSTETETTTTGTTESRTEVSPTSSDAESTTPSTSETSSSSSDIPTSSASSGANKRHNHPFCPWQGMRG